MQNTKTGHFLDLVNSLFPFCIFLLNLVALSPTGPVELKPTKESHNINLTRRTLQIRKSSPYDMCIYCSIYYRIPTVRKLESLKATDPFGIISKKIPEKKKWGGEKLRSRRLRTSTAGK